MKSKGLTLFELLISVSILSITLAFGIPGFNEMINKSRTKTAMLTLLDAIEAARATAVSHNSRATLLANNQQWEEGWVLFIDKNNDGQLSNDETPTITRGKLKGIKITASTPMDTYVSFIGTGEGRKSGHINRGAFLTGTIKICPEKTGEGYSLILSRGGRTRIDKLSTADCAQI